jgi:hypothetical protein
MDMSKRQLRVRRSLLMLGLGVAGTAAGAVAGPDRVFANQFVGEGAGVKLPTMVYDPRLQMMVDPANGQAVYEDARKLKLALPTVTAGCSDCPKKDDD